MTHIIRPTVPAILRRAFDALGANDAITVGEACEPNAVRAGGEVAAVCDFEIKLNGTRDTVFGLCTRN